MRAMWKPTIVAYMHNTKVKVLLRSVIESVVSGHVNWAFLSPLKGSQCDYHCVV